MNPTTVKIIGTGHLPHQRLGKDQSLHPSGGTGGHEADQIASLTIDVGLAHITQTPDANRQPRIVSDRFGLAGPNLAEHPGRTESPGVGQNHPDVSGSYEELLVGPTQRNLGEDVHSHRTWDNALIQVVRSPLAGLIE